MDTPGTASLQYGQAVRVVVEEAKYCLPPPLVVFSALHRTCPQAPDVPQAWPLEKWLQWLAADQPLTGNGWPVIGPFCNVVGFNG